MQICKLLCFPILCMSFFNLCKFIYTFPILFVKKNVFLCGTIDRMSSVNFWTFNSCLNHLISSVHSLMKTSITLSEIAKDLIKWKVWEKCTHQYKLRHEQRMMVFNSSDSTRLHRVTIMIQKTDKRGVVQKKTDSCKDRLLNRSTKFMFFHANWFRNNDLRRNLSIVLYSVIILFLIWQFGT